MPGEPLEPWASSMRLDASSTLQTHRYADRFSVVRVETSGPLGGAVHKSSSVPALLVTMFVRRVPARHYRLWVDGKIASAGAIAAFGANVIDLAAEPAMWGDAGIEQVHFHIRRGAIDDAAETLGYGRLGGLRPSVAQADIVLAQITKSVLPFLGEGAKLPAFALDHLELIVGAHIVQRYGSPKERPAIGGGLAAWQRKRATELLRENLAGRVRLADLAQACELSVSHFARSFKASFGVSSHRWLTERRIERAKDLLLRTNTSLADIAREAGFIDQAAFTRAFHRLVGLTPGRWRREHVRSVG